MSIPHDFLVFKLLKQEVHNFVCYSESADSNDLVDLNLKDPLELVCTSLTATKGQLAKCEKWGTNLADLRTAEKSEESNENKYTCLVAPRPALRF